MVSLKSTGKKLSNNAPHYHESRAAGILIHLLNFRRKYVRDAA